MSGAIYRKMNELIRTITSSALRRSDFHYCVVCDSIGLDIYFYVRFLQWISDMSGLDTL